jgi:hypothetical protein
VFLRVDQLLLELRRSLLLLTLPLLLTKTAATRPSTTKTTFRCRHCRHRSHRRPRNVAAVDRQRSLPLLRNSELLLSFVWFVFLFWVRGEVSAAALCIQTFRGNYPLFLLYTSPDLVTDISKGLFHSDHLSHLLSSLPRRARVPSSSPPMVTIHDRSSVVWRDRRANKPVVVAGPEVVAPPRPLSDLLAEVNVQTRNIGRRLRRNAANR